MGELRGRGIWRRRWWAPSTGSAQSAIYGAVIGGATIAAGDDDTPVSDVAIALVVTVVIFWVAERWSQLLGSHVAGEAVNRHRIAGVFVEGWPMVQATYLPLVVLGVTVAAGANANLCADLALLSIVVLLVVLGVLGGRRADLSGWRLVGAGAFTGLLGAALIVLKSLVH